MGCELELLKTKSKPAKARKLDLPKGVPPLSSLYMYIAGSCNLACRHCWISPTYEPDNSKGQFLKLEYVKKAVTEAKSLGLQSVKLTGGEPLLHPQFREIVAYLENEGIDIIVETNGTLIDKDLAGFLKSKHHVRFISVSLDGANAKTHEILRGVKKSFNLAVKGIKNLVSVGFRPQIICTLYQGNISEIWEVIELAQNIGSGSVKFNNIQSIGRGEFFNKHLVLKTKKIIASFVEIEKNKKKKSKIPIFFDIPFAFYPINKFLYEGLSRCSIKNVMGVLSDGSIALCGIGVTIPELVFGNVGFDDLKTIWCYHKGVIYIRKEIPYNLEGICGKCMHRDICLGGCIAGNYHSGGNLNSPHYFCEIADQNNLFPISRKMI